MWCMVEKESNTSSHSQCLFLQGLGSPSEGCASSGALWGVQAIFLIMEEWRLNSALSFMQLALIHFSATLAGTPSIPYISFSFMEGSTSSLYNKWRWDEASSLCSCMVNWKKKCQNGWWTKSRLKTMPGNGVFQKLGMRCNITLIKIMVCNQHLRTARNDTRKWNSTKMMAIFILTMYHPYA